MKVCGASLFVLSSGSAGSFSGLVNSSDAQLVYSCLYEGGL